MRKLILVLILATCSSILKCDLLFQPIPKLSFSIDNVNIAITSHADSQIVSKSKEIEDRQITIYGISQNVVTNQEIKGCIYLIFNPIEPQDEHIWIQCQAKIYEDGSWTGYGDIDYYKIFPADTTMHYSGGNTMRGD